MENIINNELSQIENEIISLRNQTAQNLIKIGLKLIDAKKYDWTWRVGRMVKQ